MESATPSSSTLSSPSSRYAPKMDWVTARARNLTMIYATHGHGDHFFGAGAFLERFPGARFVATPDVIEIMRQQTSPQYLTSFWKRRFPARFPIIL